MKSELTPFPTKDGPAAGGYDPGVPLWTEKATAHWYPKCGWCRCDYPATMITFDQQTWRKPQMLLCPGHWFHLTRRLGFCGPFHYVKPRL